jgi:hypothetical protein
MNSIPKTDAAWLEEVKHAYADAAEALGDPVTPAVLYTIAPNVCAKFRGLPAAGAEFDNARSISLGSYLATWDTNAKAFKHPEVAFAFCYVAAHFGYGLISREDVGPLMGYIIDFRDEICSPVKGKAVKAKPKVPAKPTPILDELFRLTAGFCTAELNEEYMQLCRKLIEKGGRKRTVPFASGQPSSWAAGVVHAICTVNFAFDKTQKPNVTPAMIAQHFGVSQNTASQKSKALRDMFKMEYWDSEFGTSEMIEKNPLRSLGIL